MEQLIKLTGEISNVIWGWPMMILLLGTHIYLTIRLKIPQRRLFTAIKISLQKDKSAQGDVSQFAALATSLAATIGTGNIIGVATAVSLGGPGAVLWCWLTGIFGIASKYGEGLLAIKYRVKSEDGRMLGGPMYALEKGLGLKWLAILFCIFTAIATFGIGNTVQANAISENLSLVCENFIAPEHTKMITGFVLATFVGFAIIGGVKSIAKWCTALVPFMALFYVLGCIYILCINHEYLGSAISLIFNEAFSLKAVGGGTAGTVLMASHADSFPTSRAWVLHQLSQLRHKQRILSGRLSYHQQEHSGTQLSSVLSPDWSLFQASLHTLKSARKTGAC